MNRGKLIIVLLFVASWLVPNAYHLAIFLPYYPHVNLFIIPQENTPDSFWYIKLLCQELRTVLLSYALYRVTLLGKRNFGSILVRVTQIGFIYYVSELALFFINFQQAGYGVTLTITIVATWITILKELNK